MKHSEALIEKLGFGYDWSDYNKKKIDDYVDDKLKVGYHLGLYEMKESISIIYDKYSEVMDVKIEELPKQEDPTAC